MNGKIFGFSILRRPNRADVMASEIRTRAQQLEEQSAVALRIARERTAVGPRECPQCGTVTPHCRLTNGLHICGFCGTEH